MQKSKMTSYKNANLFYRIGGRGKFVFLLHGFGEDGNIWNDLAEALETNFHVIVPDLPGSGKSDILKISPKETPLSSAEAQEANNVQHITIEDYADAVKFILDQESIADCIMIGHSMGGYITLAFAEKYSERLNGLGLFHSSAFADDEEKIKLRLKAIDFIKDNGAHAFLQTSIPGLFTDNFKWQHKEEVEKLIAEGIYFSKESLIQYYKAMIRRPDRSDILKKLYKPVLFIAGEKDKAIPLQSSLRQCYLPSVCYFHILPDSAHMGMLEDKQNAKKFLSEFINSF